MSCTAFCFDLDGTLTTTEILPCIAAELGVAGEIATLTRLTMGGLIPFEDSMRLRTLILGQVPLARVHEVIASVPMAGELFDFVRCNVDRCFVVTGNLDLWIAPLVEQLGCQVFSSRAILMDGMVRLESILVKDEAVHQLRASGRFDRIVAVGDGANDVAMLHAADLGIAYGGVHAPAGATIQAANLVIHDAGTLCKLLKAL
ncbi:Phosphoserine phosphatase [gamma proteobacterium HdN1]|nr:Phosphoserine phosphatase [gamma proteobacterium HdN1]